MNKRRPESNDFESLGLDGEKLTEELNELLDAAMPDVENTFAELRGMDLDDRPMRVRHLEEARLLQQAALRYFIKTKKKVSYERPTCTHPAA